MLKCKQISLYRKHLPSEATVSFCLLQFKEQKCFFSEQALSAVRMDSSLPQSLHTTVKHKCCGLFILFKCSCQPEEQLATRWLQQQISQGQMNLVILRSVSSSRLKCCVMRCRTFSRSETWILFTALQLMCLASCLSQFPEKNKV